MNLAGNSNAGRDGVKVALAFAAIYLIWGSTFLAIRFAVQSLPPLLMMGTRHLIAGGALLGWMVRRERAWPSAAAWKPALVASAFLFLGCHGLLAWAELRVDSGMAALLSATLPIWMVLLAGMRGQEQEFSAPVAGGIVVGLIGVAVLMGVGGGQHSELMPSLAILAGEMFWAVGAIYVRGSRVRVPAVMFTAMQMVAGGAWLWVVGLALGEAGQVQASSFDARTVLSLLFLIVFGSLIAFTAYMWLLQVSTPARVSTHSYVNPLVAVALGWLFGGEALTGRVAVGTVIILASVGLLNLKRQPAPRPERVEVAAD